VASQTIIDQLLVTLGLDASGFTKGQKEAAKSLLDTETKVKASGEGMGRQLEKLAAKWLTVTAVIAGVKKAVSVIDDVAQRTRQLGIDSKNYGVAANELRNLENAVEMFGGTAEGTRKAVAGFQGAMYNLAYNGEVSDSLMMLGRMGVQFQTATGGARNFQAVVLDTADAIAKLQQNGMSRADANSMLQQAGFDEGTAQMILAGRGAAESELTRQAGRRQVSAEDDKTAIGIRQASIGKDQALETLKIRAMNGVGGIQKGVNEFLDKLGSGDATAALNQLASGAVKAGTAMENWALKAEGVTRGIRNNNPGNIRAVGNQRRDREGFRVFDSMEEGVLKANEQLDRYAKGGVNKLGDIVKKWAPSGENNTEAYTKFMEKQMGVGRGTVIDDSNRAEFLANMFKEESGSKAPSWDDVADILTTKDDKGVSPLDISAGAVPTPGADRGRGAGAVTNVDIQSITVNTQATNAQQIAGDIDDAMRRKTDGG
jgi:hypothetical protein